MQVKSHLHLFEIASAISAHKIFFRMIYHLHLFEIASAISAHKIFWPNDIFPPGHLFEIGNCGNPRLIKYFAPNDYITLHLFEIASAISAHKIFSRMIYHLHLFEIASAISVHKIFFRM